MGAIFLAGFEFLSLIIAFLYFRNSSLKSVRIAVLWSVIIFFLLCVCYIFAISLFVFEAPTTGERFVSGFICKPDGSIIASLYREQCPFLSSDALASATYEADRLWTQFSISVVRTFIFINWILLFTSFVFSVSLFIAYRSSQRFIR